MHRVADVALAIVAVAAIMVIVRPGSQASQVIQAIGSSFSGAIGAATGGVRQRPTQQNRGVRRNR